MGTGINYLQFSDKLWGSDGSSIKVHTYDSYLNKLKDKNSIEFKLYNKYKNMTLSEFIKDTSL